LAKRFFICAVSILISFDCFFPQIQAAGSSPLVATEEAGYYDSYGASYTCSGMCGSLTGHCYCPPPSSLSSSSDYTEQWPSSYQWQEPPASLAADTYIRQFEQAYSASYSSKPVHSPAYYPQLSPNKSEEVVPLKPVDQSTVSYPASSIGSLKLTEPAYASLRGTEALYSTTTNMKGIEPVHHTASLKSLETTAAYPSSSLKTLEPMNHLATTSSSSSSSYQLTTNYHPNFPDSTPDSYFQPCQIFQLDQSFPSSMPGRPLNLNPPPPLLPPSIRGGESDGAYHVAEDIGSYQETSTPPPSCYMADPRGRPPHYFSPPLTDASLQL